MACEECKQALSHKEALALGSSTDEWRKVKRYHARTCSQHAKNPNNPVSARYSKRYASATDVPMLENYPPLAAWLDKHNAHCIWQVERNVDADYRHDVRVEQWIVNGATVILVLLAAKRGWEIYTTCPSLSIEATLLDADKRIGIEP